GPKQITPRQELEQKKAIEAIRERGGEVGPDEIHPNEADLLLVAFMGEKFRDDDMKLLRQIPTVGTFILRDTSVTNIGLKNLKELPNLRYVRICGLKPQNDEDRMTWVKDLARVEQLDFALSDFGDKDMSYLKGLKHLQRLGLSNTKV